jgi:small-conductance mechanosensitive channel
MLSLIHTWEMWFRAAAILGGAVLLGMLAHIIIFATLRRLARRTGSGIDDSLVRHSHRPAKAILPLVALFATLPITPLAASVADPLRHAIIVALIAATAWLSIGIVDVFVDAVSEVYRTDVQDNLRARRVQTQVRVLRRIAIAVITVVAVSVILMTFPSIRQFGVSLFASAGLAGLVVAMAARPALSNLLAGMQIALSEPIRIDDVVIVEGEWGWIEEIGTTYVVVRIWDLRRLVVPLSYFIEKPFQNWTRTSADLLGTVMVYVDYSVPVEEVREELQQILKSSSLWDGKVWNLQVTNATEQTMELRALMSASDSGKAWDLRCYVRERLIEFLQRRYPQSLPRTRAEVRMLATAS